MWVIPHPKDDTALSLESGARMIIDDFVYDPDTPTEGSMNANVLGGGFSLWPINVAQVVGVHAMTVTACFNDRSEVPGG